MDTMDIPGMPDNLDDMTMREVKEFVIKQQEVNNLKKQAIQKLCWDEIGEVCKKYSCMIKPVVKLNEMQDGQYTFYGDLVVVAMELEDEQPSESNGTREPSGDDKSDDKESSESPDDAREEQGHESSSSEDDKA